MSSRKFRAAILVSGSGSNMEALMTAGEKGGLPHVEFVLVVSNRPQAGALAKAGAHGVKAVVVDSKMATEAAFQDEVLNVLDDHQIDIVCLAGYLKKVGPRIVERFRGRILNIHPALLPAYGGPGMYGHFVHEAVLKASEKESGCSVHLVDDEFDHGPVLAQAKVSIQPGDTPEILAQRILVEEHQLYPRVLAQFSERLAGSGEKQ